MEMLEIKSCSLCFIIWELAVIKKNNKNKRKKEDKTKKPAAGLIYSLHLCKKYYYNVVKQI